MATLKHARDARATRQGSVAAKLMRRPAAKPPRPDDRPDDPPPDERAGDPPEGPPPGSGQTSPKPPPIFHLDLVEIAGDRCFVLGWAVRKPSDDPEVYIRRPEGHVSPLVTFQRPDVVEYFTYTRSSTVDRLDIAASFAFAFEATSLDGLTLSMQGHQVTLVAHNEAPETDLGFLKRYMDAMLSLPPSPALTAARLHFQTRLIRRSLPIGAPSAPAQLERPQGAPLSALLAACTAHGPIFDQAPAAGGRVALLAIHQKSRHLTRSHAAMLAALSARGYRVVLINSSADSEAGLAEVEAGRCAGLVRRPDHGRDFASWLIAHAMLHDRLAPSEHVLFCNDSFFGPFDDLAAPLDHQARSNADFWALTDSWDRGYHLQSSFFVLSARALHSDAFRHFTTLYGYPNDRNDVVEQGELGLSRVFVEDGGVSMAAMAPYAALARQALDRAPAMLEACHALPERAWRQEEDPDAVIPAPRGYPEEAAAFVHKLLGDLRNGIPRNPQHVFWQALLTDYRIGFVKKELMLSNPAGVPDYHRVLPTISDLYGRERAEDVEHDMRLGGRRAPAY